MTKMATFRAPRATYPSPDKGGPGLLPKIYTLQEWLEKHIGEGCELDAHDITLSVRCRGTVNERYIGADGYDVINIWDAATDTHAHLSYILDRRNLPPGDFLQLDHIDIDLYRLIRAAIRTHFGKYATREGGQAILSWEDAKKQYPANARHPIPRSWL